MSPKKKQNKTTQQQQICKEIKKENKKQKVRSYNNLFIRNKITTSLAL